MGGVEFAPNKNYESQPVRFFSIFFELMINEINTFSDLISDSISITRVPNRSSVDTLKAESVLFKRVM